MRKQVLFLLTSILTLHLSAQTAGPQKTLQPILTLKMPLTADDDMPGRRGASVVWHPVQIKYYAAMAGNVAYPLAIFDVKGNRLSNDSSVCLEDIRGLWYNPDAKAIQGNAYGDNGWFSYILDAKGNVNDYETTVEGMNQPNEQAVGVYDYKDKKVLFLQRDTLFIYDSKDGSVLSVTEINFGKMKSSSQDDLADSGVEDYNYTTVIYTGIKDAEIGFLNITKKQIELYDYATGHLTKTLPLPEDAPAEANFNFAYANNIYWLFDMDGRTWHGYK